MRFLPYRTGNNSRRAGRGVGQAPRPVSERADRPMWPAQHPLDGSGGGPSPVPPDRQHDLPPPWRAQAFARRIWRPHGVPARPAVAPIRLPIGTAHPTASRASPRTQAAPPAPRSVPAAPEGASACTTALYLERAGG